jgi:hypothetical protein
MFERNKLHLGACVLYAETAKAAQVSLEREVAKLKDEQEAQSRALAEVSQWPALLLCFMDNASANCVSESNLSMHMSTGCLAAPIVT